MAKAKAIPPPPQFTLTAASKYAAGTIRVWCVTSQKNGTASLDEINEAYATADEFDAWRAKYAGEA